MRGRRTPSFFSAVALLFILENENTCHCARPHQELRRDGPHLHGKNLYMLLSKDNQIFNATAFNESVPRVDTGEGVSFLCHRTVKRGQSQSSTDQSRFLLIHVLCCFSNNPAQLCIFFALEDDCTCVECWGLSHLCALSRLLHKREKLVFELRA